MIQGETIQYSEGGRRVRRDFRPEPPLISIITVVFNAEVELGKILDSVFDLDVNKFELIVIDGGSKDGTVELLREWDSKIEYWRSEPDAGIYDAMNKARLLSKGQFLYHLNAGDRLIYLPTEDLTLALEDGVDIVTSRVLIDGEREFQPSTSWKLKVKNTFHHQGTFYRRESFSAYDLQYRIYADFDLNQRAILGGAKVQILDKVVAVHSTAGMSNTAEAAESEHYRIILKNYGWRYLAVSWLQRKWDGVMVRFGRASLKV